jgi:hypothetical protein
MREPVTLHPRKPLTPKQRAQLALDQKGLCGCGCGQKLDHAREGTIGEHGIPLWAGGDNSIGENVTLWRKPCSDAKTLVEHKPRAKVKRLIAKSDKATRKPPKMKSAGFRPKPPGFKHSWPKRRFGA